MFRLITILLAVGAVAFAVKWYRRQRRADMIEEMSPDELVDAIIRREISVLEVPPEHREAVNRMLREIQKELDNV